MDSTVALLFEVTGVTVISLTSLPTVAVYAVTLPLNSGESVPCEIFKEDKELSPDFAAFAVVSVLFAVVVDAAVPEEVSVDAALPDTLICVPAAVTAAPSAFT